MTEARAVAGAPRRILLATDLSARCDRALDRAIQLAAEWSAQLFVVHALESTDGPDSLLDKMPGRKLPDPLTLARRQLVRDVGAVADDATLLIERGRPADVIASVAAREGCDLIVLGIARDELLGRYALGTTVDRLMRAAPAPLLIAKSRSHRHYHHIVVASDFSASSRHALKTAQAFFPDERPTLFHAYEPPMENLVEDRAAYVRSAGVTAMEAAMAFLAEKPPAAGTPEPELVVEHGDPAELLRHHAHHDGTDLVVLASHGRSAVYEIFIGSVAKKILDTVPCDCLLVREPKAAREA